MAVRRFIYWLLALVLVGGTLATLWWVSARGVTPEQRLADAEPPPAPVVNVEIEERHLEDSVVFRGIVRAIETVEVRAPQLAEGTAGVVVDLPAKVGKRVTSGQVVAVVSDRPVIVAEMPVPLYRELLPGMTGDDVVRLQEMLVEEGYEIDVDGRLGPETQAAITDFYESLGFEPVRTGEDLNEALRTADDALEDAQTAAEAARAAGGSTWSKALGDLADAEKRRNEAAARIGVVVPLGEILGLPEFPAVVARLESRVGETVDGPLLSLTTSDLVIESIVDPGLAVLLEPGMQASAGDDGDLAVVVDSNKERDDQGQALVRLVANEQIPEGLLGADLRVEAVLAATDGDVLAVPVTAIRSGADGPIVRVVEEDGTTRDIGVTTGASIGGWVEIAGSDEELSPGTLVRAG